GLGCSTQTLADRTPRTLRYRAPLLPRQRVRSIGRKESGNWLIRCWSAYPDLVIDIDGIRDRSEALEPVLDERGRRLFAASERVRPGMAGSLRYHGRRGLRAARSIAVWQTWIRAW